MLLLTTVNLNVARIAPPTVDLPTATAPASSVKAVVPQFRPQQQLALPVPETDSSNGQILAVALLVYRFCNGVLSGGEAVCCALVGIGADYHCSRPRAAKYVLFKFLPTRIETV